MNKNSKVYIPKDLILIKKVLEKVKYKLSDNNSDGRINSSIHEKEIINILREEGLGDDIFYICPDRYWCDIVLTKTSTPINIKTSYLKSSDNTCNMTSLLHCFTDMDVITDRKSINSKKALSLFESMYNKNTAIKKDYFFLVINKNNPNDIIINSLKSLNKVTTNINNLPFQVKWNDNREMVYRNWEQQTKFLYNIIKDTKKKESIQTKFINLKV